MYVEEAAAQQGISWLRCYKEGGEAALERELGFAASAQPQAAGGGAGGQHGGVASAAHKFARNSPCPEAGPEVRGAEPQCLA
jgi:hypothetical protein